MNTSTTLLMLLHASDEGELSLDDIMAQIAAPDGPSRQAVVMAAGVLADRGLIERPAPGHYRLTAAGRLAAESGQRITSGPWRGHAIGVQQRSLRARLWRAMRALKKFGLTDLLLRAARGDEGDAENNAFKYCRALEKAGYLVRIRRQPGEAPTSPGYVRWVLVRDTGPMPPIWSHRTRQIFDPNTGEYLEVRHEGH